MGPLDSAAGEEVVFFLFLLVDLEEGRMHRLSLSSAWGRMGREGERERKLSYSTLSPSLPVRHKSASLLAFKSTRIRKQK